MKLKKVLSMVLVGAMAAALLAGCGGSSDETEEENAAVQASAETEAAEGEADSEDAGFAGFESLQTIDLYAMDVYGAKGLEEVEAAVNEISESLINVHVNLNYLDTATYMEQIGLMLSGGEAFDLVMDTALPVVSFATMQSQNELMDISPYLEEYAPEMTELMEPYLASTTIGDAIYAIPCYRIYNSSEYIIMRKDILDELGLTEQAEAIASWSDYEAVVEAVYNAQSELPEEMKTSAMISNTSSEGNVMADRYVATGADSFADCFGYDTLGDQSKLIAVDSETNTVYNYFASDSYKQSVERVNDWYNKGYVYKDSATSDDAGDTLMANGITFSYIVQSEIGVETAKKNSVGYDVVCVKMIDIPVQTANGTAWAWSVPSTAENPEAAVAFLNLMYTNADIENLLVFGIEGRDYEFNEEGEAILKEDYVYQNCDFWFGNQFNAYPSIDEGGDFREVSLESMKEAEISPYYGFVLDTNEISNELTALANVQNQYEAALEGGLMDASMIDEMNEKLEASGLQTVLDYYQNALDEWLAQQ